MLNTRDIVDEKYIPHHGHLLARRLLIKRQLTRYDVPPIPAAASPPRPCRLPSPKLSGPSPLCRIREVPPSQKKPLAPPPKAFFILAWMGGGERGLLPGASCLSAPPRPRCPHLFCSLFPSRRSTFLVNTSFLLSDSAVLFLWGRRPGRNVFLKEPPICGDIPFCLYPEYRFGIGCLV